MNIKISILVAIIISVFFVVGCGDETTPTSPSSTEGVSGAAGPLAVGGGLNQETGTAPLTNVGDILEFPNNSQGQLVRLEGRTTSQRGPNEFLFTDGTGDIPIIIGPGGPLPTLEVAIGVTGTVAGGVPDFPATIQVSSWEVLPPFSCDDIEDIKARFSDPGFAFGNVVGLYLSYRGAPPGDKILEMTWDEHNAAGVVEEAEIGPGDPIENGLFFLEGVVTHEYDNVNSTETKTVRAKLKIVGRDGSCSRVRDVTVSPGSGPGFGGGGTISVTIDEDPVVSGSEFSVRAKVDNKSTITADISILFQTPKKTSIALADGSGCKILDGEFVECIIRDFEPGDRQTRVVKYLAPTVVTPTDIDGAVALISGDFQPVAKYRVTVQP
jgi:uncharacterized protein YdeI (BOF family)